MFILLKKNQIAIETNWSFCNVEENKKLAININKFHTFKMNFCKCVKYCAFAIATDSLSFKFYKIVSECTNFDNKCQLICDQWWLHFAFKFWVKVIFLFILKQLKNFPCQHFEYVLVHIFGIFFIYNWQIEQKSIVISAHALLRNFKCKIFKGQKMSGNKYQFWVNWNGKVLLFWIVNFQILVHKIIFLLAIFSFWISIFEWKTFVLFYCAVLFLSEHNQQFQFFAFTMSKFNCKFDWMAAQIVTESLKWLWSNKNNFIF